MHVAIETNEHDGIGVRLDFGDDGIVSSIGQAATYPCDFVADVGRCGIGIARQFELDVDLATLSARLRGHYVDPLDA